MMIQAKEMPPAMILCGGKGTRLRDVTELLPKPMVPIGEQPIVWHIMRCYAAFGVRRFILCLGYKRECFIDYFLNFHARNSDVTITLGDKERLTFHDETPEADWEVTLANTGEETFTGNRVRMAAKYLKDSDDEFFLTYGDGVADVDLTALLAYHRSSGKALTVSAVHPEGRFGEMMLNSEGGVTGFAEKPARIAGVINGGFMVVRRDFLSRYLVDENNVFLEQEPIGRAIAKGDLAAYVHDGFWQCMDTPREYQLLNELWNSGRAPWKKFWRE